MTSRAIFILGMHRSGTSALARVVNLLGAALGPDTMRAAADNPRGFWEHEGTVAVHEQLLTELGHGWQDGIPLPEGWQESKAATTARKEIARILDTDFAGVPLWAIKDPRLSLLFPLWEPLLEERDIEPVCIVAWRNPLEVAASLAERDGLPQEAALLCWLGYTLESLHHAQRHKRAVLLYDDLLEDWQAETTRLGKALGVVWPNKPETVKEPAEAFLAPELRHHRRELILGDSPLEKMAAGCVAMLQSRGKRKPDALLRQWREATAPTAELLRGLRRETKELHKALGAKSHASGDWQQQMEQLQQKHRALWQEKQSLEHRLADRDHDLARREQEMAVLQSELTAVLESASWKLTRPLRELKAALTGHFPPPHAGQDQGGGGRSAADSTLPTSPRKRGEE